MYKTRSESQRVSKGAVERKNLLMRLAQARQRSCMLIQGPAGCGKTTLSSQWRAAAVSYDYDVAAMTISPGDDSERMAENLFACLDRVDPALAREAVFAFNRSGGRLSPEPGAITIIRALAKHPRDLLLMIDDYHLLHEAIAHQFVQMLLDFAPPNFHLLLASRSAPSLSLARLRDKGALLELGGTDLRFSLAETKEFLNGQNAGLSSADVEVLHETTDGWAAGLGLVALSMRGRPKRTSIEPPIRLQNPSDFRAYFNQNVLNNLPSGDVDALTRLAVAPRFDEGLCMELLGPEAGQGLLGRLRRDNVFMIPAEGTGTGAWYRLHPLFRDQLKELFAQLPEAERDRTHLALSEAFGRRRQLRDAVHHCVAAGEVDRAADWVEQHAQALFMKGDLPRLVRAVTELPSTVLRARSSLRVWEAWAQLCYRQLGACRESLNELKATLPRDDQNVQRHLTLLELGLALQQDETEAAMPMVSTLDAMDTADDAALAGACRNILGWFHARRNEGGLAREKLAGPYYVLDNGDPLLDSPFGFLMGEGLKGYSYLKEGDMREAERSLREALRKSETVLGPFCVAAANAAGFLSPILYEIDELPELRALLDPRMDLIERAGIPDAVIFACIMRSRMHQSEGSFQEALADVERLEEVARRRGLERTLAVALAERVAIQIKTGDLKAAEETVALLRMAEARQLGRNSSAAISVRWHAALAHAACLTALRREQEALETVQATMSSGLLDDKLNTVAHLFAHAAVLQWRLKREGEALALIAQAWRIAQRTGLVRCMLDVGEEVLLLGQSAAQHGLLDEATQFHLEYVTQRAHRGESRLPTPLPTHGSLSERELAIVKALAAAMPNKRIAQALDISPDTVKWHLKNVYSKLGVYTRDVAVKRARELGYLDPHS